MMTFGSPDGPGVKSSTSFGAGNGTFMPIKDIDDDQGIVIVANPESNQGTKHLAIEILIVQRIITDIIERVIVHMFPLTSLVFTRDTHLL